MRLEFHLKHSVLCFLYYKPVAPNVLLYVEVQLSAFAFQGVYKNDLTFVKGFLIGHFIDHMAATTQIAAQIGKTMYAPMA